MQLFKNFFIFYDHRISPLVILGKVKDRLKQIFNGKSCKEIQTFMDKMSSINLQRKNFETVPGFSEIDFIKNFISD